MHRRNLFLFMLAAFLAMGGCRYAPDEESGITPGLRRPEEPVSLDKGDYPVFPDPDAGADPSVSAEDGGAGFTGEGWETNLDFDLIGDPRAVKGGTLRMHMADFPGNLRLAGPESNSAFNYFAQGLIYETLVGVHPTTQEFIPALATHWQISEDQLTYRFRINPNARFSDGTPVTADDVVATWDFMMDEGLQDPFNRLTWGKFHRPVAESPYIVRVDSEELNWRNFLYFGASLPILPAHVLATIDGETYLREFNYKMLPGSGPFEIHEEDVDRGNSITMRRREGYWAEGYRANIGLANFDAYRSVVVRDDALAYEMFKKGELDFYPVSRAQMWVEELNYDEIQRGLIQKRKIFNSNPNGVYGIAFNTRVAPFDDIRFRKALTLLYNRKQLISSLMFNEYLPQNSYYAGSIYENHDNPTNEYDPETAIQLLAEAGWSQRDSQGRLTRNGQPLELELIYSTPALERLLTPYQEDLRRLGIGLNLRLVTPETAFQLMNERRFTMMLQAWGGLVVPNPENAYHSSLADVDNTNNITGVKNARIDELCELYDRTFDIEERIAIVREIDGILASEYHYAQFWYGPYQRVLYWNKFGMPDGYIGRMADYLGSTGGPGLPQLWWIDPDKERELAAAREDPGLSMEVGDADVRYWLEYDERSGPTAANFQ